MLKDKILKKEKIVGSYVQLPDCAISRIMGLAKFDCVWVDTEHSYMTPEAVQAHIFTLHGTGTPVIVRLPQNDLTDTKRVLEMGPDGVIFPMVRTAKEAQDLVAATLYPPYGTRGFGPMGAIDFGFRDAVDYVEKSKDELCRFIQIEHIDAINNLDEISENPYIDGYIFGANDLSGSIGLLGKPYCDEVSALIEKATKILKSKGKYVGIAAGGLTQELFRHWAQFDFDMLFAGADFDFLREGAKNTIALCDKYFKNK